ncbi:iron-containing alcohol dehydrogenase [Coralliovum pocilloporae]|uniref:iron-containing alcohol dehydrogenase n=1 Tax=Coralliovum pocilloporae TaxID=3066369 RepID=UPI003307368D
MIRPTVRFALRTLSTLFPPQKPLLFSGLNSSLKLASLMVAAGHRRPLLVTGKFALRVGMLDDLLAYFDAEGCVVTIFDTVPPNPTFSVVDDGVEACRVNNCDSILIVGGGSAIDAAKVIAASYTNGKSGEKLAGLLKVKTPPLPIYVVPTTSGTGSEATPAAVVSDNKTHRKTFVVDPKLISRATALDPAMLKSLPPAMTAATTMDALTHAIEAYTSLNRFEDARRDAALAIRLIVENLPAAIDDGDDLEAREKLAIGSFLAGYAFAKTSLGYVHAISHQISAHYDTPHGVANAILLPRVMRFNKTVCQDDFAALETMLGNDRDETSPLVLSTRFIDRIEALSDRVSIPHHLDDLKVGDFPTIIRNALNEARFSYAPPKAMSKAECQAILTAVAEGRRELTF